MSRSRVDKIVIGTRAISKDNFYKHQVPDPTTGCINWDGVKNNIGYGFIGWTTAGMPTGVPGHHGMMTVHRAALAIKLGRDIAPGMNANHTCHNKLCVNPDHLEEGTQREKIHSMINSGMTIGGNVPRGPATTIQSKRKYKYTISEITWARDASIEDICVRYGFDRRKASTFRHGMRNGYRWLPWDQK